LLDYVNGHPSQQKPNQTLLTEKSFLRARWYKKVFCGAVQRILFPGPGPMMKKLTGEIAGIAPCSCFGGQISVLYEKIYGELIFLCTFTDCTFREQ
jgi:hypothetical protein